MPIPTPADRPKAHLTPAPPSPSQKSGLGKSPAPFRSAPPCISYGQLVGCGILAFAAFAYVDLTALSDFLSQSAIQARTAVQGLDPTPVGAIGKPEQADR